VYHRIALLGIGTLGGFIAEAIVENEFCKELVIFDKDTVELKNVTNSIYSEIDVGDNKVDALTDILMKKSLFTKIIKRNEMFIEGETTLQPCDLVIDCRDVIYNRGNLIDCRLHISSRHLFLDCRRNITYQEHINGKYITKVTRLDLKNSALLFSNLVSNNILQNLIQKRIVQSYDLDYFRTTPFGQCDILYEKENGEDRFLNLSDNLLPILETNRKVDTELYVGSRTDPLSKIILPKRSLQSSNEIIQQLLSATRLHCEFNNFLVVVNNNYIELIPETGAA
jgi:hypothetical protein